MIANAERSLSASSLMRKARIKLEVHLMGVLPEPSIAVKIGVSQVSPVLLFFRHNMAHMCPSLYFDVLRIPAPTQ